MAYDRRQFLKRSAATTTGLTALVASTGTAAASDVPLVSTRDHFDDDGDLVSGETKYSYDTSGDVPGVDTSCVSDLTVFVHGWDENSDDPEQAAHDKISYAQSELTGSGYDGTVIGYTWDSDKGGGADYGWNEAEDIAQKNGPKLGQFAVDFKYYCPNATLRFVSHSIGAQVLFSSLRSLDGSSWWDDKDYEIYSTHTLGAAQDNEAPTKECSDTYWAINNEVMGAFNYHSHEDDTLQWIYNTFEADQALGETGYEDGNTPAPNYTEYDGTSQVGDDHSSYLDHLSDEVVYHMEHVEYYV